MSVTIIDYGVGNLGSVKNMLKRIGINSQITSNHNAIQNADKLILPGVGRFDYGMQQLISSGIKDVLTKKVLIDKAPILGICLGAQLLTEFSEEGNVNGLGFVKGKTVKFNENKLLQQQKIPHMGWSYVSNFEKSKLFLGMPTEPKFYFVHSYHMLIEDANDVLVTANYGYTFAAGVEKDNILGVQFHPEKSHKFGMKLLDNFYNNY